MGSKEDDAPKAGISAQMGDQLLQCDRLSFSSAQKAFIEARGWAKAYPILDRDDAAQLSARHAHP